MIRYIGRRLLLIIPVVIGVSLLIFLLMNMAQGDVTATILSDRATETEREALRQ